MYLGEKMDIYMYICILFVQVIFHVIFHAFESLQEEAQQSLNIKAIVILSTQILYVLA